MTNLATAPRAANALAKRCGFTRQALGKLSKLEENNGAPPDERRSLAATFKSMLSGAKQAIADTEAEATARSNVSLILRAPDAVTDFDHPMEAKARVCALLGVPVEPLAARAAHSSVQYRQSAERAEKRLSDNADDIAATLHLDRFLDALPMHNWDNQAKGLVETRTLYQNHLQASRAQRESK